MVIKIETRSLRDAVMRLEANNSKASRAETVVLILPGGGHGSPPTRLTEVNWSEYSDSLWVAGTRGDPAYTREEILEYVTRNNKSPVSLETQIDAQHTPEQMEWAVSLLMRDTFTNHLIISTASYHLVRGVLTFVKMWEKHGDNRKLSIGIIPTSDPNPEVVATPSTTSRTLEEELARIELYQKQGDVATATGFYEFVGKS